MKVSIAKVKTLKSVRQAICERLEGGAIVPHPPVAYNVLVKL